MSDGLPTLSEIAAAHIGPECGCSDPYETDQKRGEHIADMWRYARAIDTVDQLRAIPPSPDLLGSALIKAFGVPALGSVYELNDDGTWNDLDADGGPAEHTPPEDVPLPALLIWHPDWSHA